MTDPMPNTAPENRKDPEQAKVLALYITFIVALALQLAPVVLLQIVSLALLLIVILAIGFMRRDCEKDSLMHNHATYLSRTFWMWSLILTLGALFGGYYVFQQYPDPQQLLKIAEDLAAARTDTPEFRAISRIVMASFAPSFFYLAYRLAKGLHRAVKGYRLARPKSFF